MFWWSRDGMRNFPAGAALLAVAALLPMSGARTQVVPRLTVDASVLASENPFLLPRDRRRRGAVAVEITVRPGLVYSTPAGSSLKLLGEVTARQYSRRFGSFLIGNVALEGAYRDSERLTEGADVRVSRNLSIDTLTTSVEAAVDPRSLRTAYQVTAYANWRPNAYLTVRPEVTAERSRYADSDLLTGTRSLTGGLAVSRRISAVTSVGLRGVATWSDVPDTARLRTQQFFFTVDRKLSAGWRALLELGAEHNASRLENWAGAVAPQDSRWRWSGGVEVCREGPQLTACLSGRRSTEVSGLGGLQRRTVVRATATAQVSERGTLTGIAEYNRSNVQRSLLPAIDGVRTEASYAYRIGAEATIAGVVQYLRRTLIDGRHVGAGFAGVRLSFSPSRL